MIGYEINPADISSLLTLNTNTKVTGDFTYLDAGGEQDVIEITGATKSFIDMIQLDLVNITLNGTIKIYSKIDGTNYRELDSLDFTVATDSDGYQIAVKFPVDEDFKITYTESADEGADRIIPFKYMLRD